MTLTVRHESHKHCVIEDEKKRWLATVNTEIAGKDAGEKVKEVLEAMVKSGD